jgi:hypothetical protein
VCELCVHSANSTEYFRLQSICSIADAGLRAFKLYYEEVNFCYILNFIILMFYFVIKRKELLLLCFIALSSSVPNHDKITYSVIFIGEHNSS